jgi:phage/plasmid-like protein (TIGR03299 family)
MQVNQKQEELLIMSTETIEWLNTKTLIGFTQNRGNKAWHYRADAQGDEPNHYPDAVPADDVIRRLFDWEPLTGPVETTVWTPTGPLHVRDDNRKVIVRPSGALDPTDPGGILGVFKGGYTPHAYRQWLLEELEQILGQGLSIGSAGLLKQGAIGWVSIEMPDNIVTPSGVAFRPNLLACTSLDGSLATTYQRVCTLTVCDNTMAAALSESPDQRLKVKHTKNSAIKLGEARDALGIVFDLGEQFSAQVEELTNTTVTDDQWNKFLLELVPATESLAGITRADNIRGKLTQTYRHDDRCKDWTGTAFGVLQSVNTYYHHIATAKNDAYEERNMMRAVKGEVAKLDGNTLALLDKVLA